jgi:membrane-associated phospholipid phosphatase
MTKALQKYKHALWLLYLPVYFTAFSLAENYITTDYWVSYTPLDDKIPFIEQFVIAYAVWFPAIWGTGLYLLFRDPDPFRRYVWSLIIGYSFSLAVYFIFPNGQNLRPASFEHTNIFTDAVRAFYTSDTNTNVLPSMHVIGASAVVFAVFDSKKLRRPWLCVTSVIVTVMIDLSTVFIKQHSILDVWAGLAVSAAVYIIVYGVIRKRQSKKANVPAYSATVLR